MFGAFYMCLLMSLSACLTHWASRGLLSTHWGTAEFSDQLPEALWTSEHILGPMSACCAFMIQGSKPDYGPFDKWLIPPKSSLWLPLVSIFTCSATQINLSNVQDFLFQTFLLSMQNQTSCQTLPNVWILTFLPYWLPIAFFTSSMLAQRSLMLWGLASMWWNINKFCQRHS